MAEFVPDPQDVEEVWTEATVRASTGENPWPAQTYIQGVKDALGWVLGNDDDQPLAELMGGDD